MTIDTSAEALLKLASACRARAKHSDPFWKSESDHELDRAAAVLEAFAAERAPPADVVERVAREVCAHKGINPDAIHQVVGGPHAVEDDKGTRYVYGWQKQIDLATAALSALRPGDEIPAGVVVPKYPTNEMQAAGLLVSDRHIKIDDEDGTPFLSGDGVIEVWAHMLSAIKGGEHE